MEPPVGELKYLTAKLAKIAKNRQLSSFQRSLRAEIFRSLFFSRSQSAL
jgi:hypothetical protein